MGVSLIEPAIDGLQKYLIANLPAAITQVNSEHSDGITVPQLQNVFVAEQAQISPVQTPALLILGDESDLDGQSIDYLTERHPITIIIAAAAPQADTLRRILYRLTVAVVRTLTTAMKANGIPGVQLNFEKRLARYSSVYTSHHPGFFQDVQILVQAVIGEAT